MTIPWRDRAFCHQPWINESWFFPVKGNGMARMFTAAAKAACAECPVTLQCTADALRCNDEWSIRGGMAPVERGTFDNSDPARRKEARRVGVPHWTTTERLALADALDYSVRVGQPIELADLFRPEAGAA